MKNKKILVIVVALVLVAAIVAGIVFMGGASKEPVGVYPFNMVGMDGYWGDSQESYGPISTDKIQTVYLSDTQTVTEVFVTQGDEVKKGDVLMTFDTTLSDLQLERKRLEVEKLKLQLTEAKEEWYRIKKLEPMEDPGDIIIPEPTLPEISPGSPISSAYVFETYVETGHDGLTPETAFICWLKSDTKIDIPMLDDMRQYLWKFYGLTALCQHGNLPASCVICNPPQCVHGVVKSECKTCSPEICEHNNIADFCEECHPCPHGEKPSECDICRPPLCDEHENIEAFCKYCNPCIHNKPAGECGICYPHLCQHGLIEALCPDCSPPQCIHGDDCTICHPPQPSPNPTPEPGHEPEGEHNGETTEGQSIAFSGTPYRIQFLSNTEEDPDEEGGASTPVTSTDMDFYVVFKTTTGDTDLGTTALWQGLHVTYKDGLYSQQFFTPMITDYTQPEMEDESTSVLPDLDMGSGLTATQIAAMRVEQEKKIIEIDFNIRMATAEYKIMQKEVSDGKVYAEIDGQVVSLLSEQEAKDTRQPVVKVSGGGGFFITGSVSELEKENLKPGQEVTVNDWSNGGMYTGTVRSIGDFPSLDGYWNGNGNPNTSYYPFTVFVGEEASLQAGSYASIQYSTAEENGGIYMDKAFVRTEDGRSYVLVRGADNTLEKRFVTTGKNLWGSYLEITSGLTTEDYIAFPYGKDVKPGAPTKESDLSELYGY